MAKLTYKDAGVDTHLKDDFVDDIKQQVRATQGPRVMDNFGAFAGLFRLFGSGRGKSTYRDPVLVSSTDGVGTKLKIAFAMDKHDTVGIDLVAMSVNDLITTGAEPLFFLDYIATEKIDPAVHRDVVKGICTGCAESGCAVLGGETAQMPGMYKSGEYDLAGFAVGVIEKADLIDGRKVRPGNVLIGLASSGLHSNGYSLVRKVLMRGGVKALKRNVPELGCPLGDELLRPTRLYARAVAAATSAATSNPVKAIMNITGGGFYENVPRSLPDGVAARIDRASWEVPAVFNYIRDRGDIETDEMYRTFNMGVGMVMAVAKTKVDVVLGALADEGYQACIIGDVIESKDKLVWA